MASQVGTGTFWQDIVDQVTGPPADPARRDPGRLADPHADPLTRLGVTATLGLLLLSPAWRTAAVVATRAAGVAPGGVEREGGDEQRP